MTKQIRCKWSCPSGTPLPITVLTFISSLSRRRHSVHLFSAILVSSSQPSLHPQSLRSFQFPTSRCTVFRQSLSKNPLIRPWRNPGASEVIFKTISIIRTKATSKTLYPIFSLETRYKPYWGPTCIFLSVLCVPSPFFKLDSFF